MSKTMTIPFASEPAAIGRTEEMEGDRLEKGETMTD